MYSMHNEGKSVVAETFIRTLKNKIYKYMTRISKNMYINKLDDIVIVNKYNNTYHGATKIKSVDVKSSTYIDFDKNNSNGDPKFKVSDHLRMSTCKNIFTKGYAPNWSGRVFVITKVKNTVSWRYFISDLKGGEIFGTFTKKNCKKTTQKEFRIEKAIEIKEIKLHVICKGYDNTFNS